MILIEIYGAPIPLNRPRACKRGSFVTVYDSQKKEKEHVQWQIRARYHDDPLQGPLMIDLGFYMPIPKQTSKVKTRRMLQGDMVPMKKPDIDNLIKFILDTLNGILFIDDSQIIEIKARKCYSDNPRTLVIAKALEKTVEQVYENNSGDSGQGEVY